MKIVIPVIGFGRAGGERVLSKLATELIGDNKENDVSFVKPRNGTKPYYPTSANIIESTFHSDGFKPFDYLRNLLEIVILCRKLKPDVVIANYFITAYLAIFLSRKTSKYYYIQANESKINKNIIFKVLAFFSYLLPLKKIVNSTQLLPKWLNNYIAEIPAGVDLNLYKNKKVKRDISKWKVGFIGRKEKYKASNEIVDILFSLEEHLKEKIEVHVALYLSDDNKDKLFAYNFHEVNSDADLANFYNECDILIAVGLIEDGAFHYPCAEAMASGCLVISNYAPLKDSHLRIDSFSALDVTDKLTYCLEIMSPKQIDSEIERNSQIMQNYSWKNIGSKFKTIISSGK
ncbi:hypothetical protein ACRWQM_04855 [Shewanella sp. HL-SH5]|uniref:hypothetical protein n=1 Tax=Shewanella sp. HL-SH5 TaxID=3436241 RepID=UPI003EB90DAF